MKKIDRDHLLQSIASILPHYLPQEKSPLTADDNYTIDELLSCSCSSSSVSPSFPLALFHLLSRICECILGVSPLLSSSVVVGINNSGDDVPSIKGLSPLIQQRISQLLTTGLSPSLSSTSSSCYEECFRSYYQEQQEQDDGIVSIDVTSTPTTTTAHQQLLETVIEQIITSLLSSFTSTSCGDDITIPPITMDSVLVKTITIVCDYLLTTLLIEHVNPLICDSNSSSSRHMSWYDRIRALTIQDVKSFHHMLLEHHQPPLQSSFVTVTAPSTASSSDNVVITEIDDTNSSSPSSSSEDEHQVMKRPRVETDHDKENDSHVVGFDVNEESTVLKILTHRCHCLIWCQLIFETISCSSYVHYSIWKQLFVINSDKDDKDKDTCDENNPTATATATSTSISTSLSKNYFDTIYQISTTATTNSTTATTTSSSTPVFLSTMTLHDWLSLLSIHKHHNNNKTADRSTSSTMDNKKVYQILTDMSNGDSNNDDSSSSSSSSSSSNSSYKSILDYVMNADYIEYTICDNKDDIEMMIFMCYTLLLLCYRCYRDSINGSSGTSSTSGTSGLEVDCRCWHNSQNRNVINKQHLQVLLLLMTTTTTSGDSNTSLIDWDFTILSKGATRYSSNIKLNMFNYSFELPSEKRCEGSKAPELLWLTYYRMIDQVAMSNDKLFHKLVNKTLNTNYHDLRDSEILVNGGEHLLVGGYSAIHIAAYHSDLPGLQALIEKGKGNVNLISWSDHGDGPSVLITALANNAKPEIIQYLIEHGADVNHALDSGGTFESLYSYSMYGFNGFTPLMMAVNMLNSKNVEVLLRASSTTSTNTTNSRTNVNTKLAVDAYSGYLDDDFPINVEELHHIFYNTGNKCIFTAFHIACKLKQLKIVKLLIELGHVDINAPIIYIKNCPDIAEHAYDFDWGDEDEYYDNSQLDDSTNQEIALNYCSSDIGKLLIQHGGNIFYRNAFAPHEVAWKRHRKHVTTTWLSDDDDDDGSSCFQWKNTVYALCKAKELPFDVTYCIAQFYLTFYLIDHIEPYVVVEKKKHVDQESDSENDSDSDSENEGERNNVSVNDDVDNDETNKINNSKNTSVEYQELTELYEMLTGPLHTMMKEYDRSSSCVASNV